MCMICASLNPASLTAAGDSHINADPSFGFWVSVFGGSGPPTRTPTPRAASLDALANHLTTGYWTAKGAEPRSFQLGEGRIVTVNLSGLDIDAQFVARTALAAWSDVTNINFVESYDKTAQIVFDDEGTLAAYTQTFVAGNRITQSFVNVSADWEDPVPLSINSYWFQTYLHEIGHALGLGHAGNYNGSAQWGVNNKFSNDSWQASVMSYFAQPQNPNTQGASYAFTATAMAADIIAIQALYGAGVTRTGDTVYGNNTNVDGYLGDLFRQWLGGTPADPTVYLGKPITLTLFDSGGSDTLDVSGISAAQKVDLNPEAKSNIAGLVGNVIIARGTIIEHAIGGEGNDSILGNNGDNGLNGGGGADLIDGRRGNDILNGDAGNDTLLGGDGNDLLLASAGADRSDGGNGFDTVSYQFSTSGLIVDLAAPGSNGGDAVGDTYILIEAVIGGSGADIIRGGAGAENLQGMDNSDQLFGRAGNDTLNGGAGDDLLIGGRGADVLNGGEGRDRADYADAAAGVTIALGDAIQLAAAQPFGAFGAISGFGGGLSTASARGRGGRGRGPTGNDGTGDTFISVEDLSGSNFNDRLTGNSGANALSGNNGNDVLNGGDGNDVLNGDRGNDTMTGGTGADTFIFASGRDVVTDFVDNIDTLALAYSLFSSVSVTVAEALAYAMVEGGNIVFRFNDVDTFILNGVTNITALQDDLIFI